MIKTGDYNKLIVSRIAPFGVYLSDPSDGSEILLPNRYVTPEMEPGTTVEVFVYTDSEDRPVATTERPYVRVGQFAFLQTIQVNRVGTFMDWGLAKNLLVPFKELKIKMFPGGIYLVYVYLDHNTGRVVASARIDKFLDNVFPEYEPGAEVETLIIGHNEIGYKVIVDNRHSGMIYKNEVYKPLEIGARLRAYVKHIRPDDGKIDLTLNEPDTRSRIDRIGTEILRRLREGEKVTGDSIDPEVVKKLYGCSKRDYKKALGLLYREREIAIDNETDTIKLAKK